MLPVPVIGYSPETRTYLGAAALVSFGDDRDSLTRDSNADVEFNATWNKQFIVEIGWDYFFRSERWFTMGEVHISRYPDLYYGIGNDTPAGNEVLYHSNRYLFEIGLLKSIGRQLFAGPRVKYMKFSRVIYEESPVEFPELVSSSVTGIGFSILKDTRNSLLTPMSGIYLHGDAGYNFSEEHYSEFMLDFRYYETWSGKFTLALRFLNDFAFGRPPFYDYSFLGGDRYVRGYALGRYRDHHLTTLQAEMRIPVIWRIGLAGFGGWSYLYPSMNEFRMQGYRYNLGMGLRFLADRKSNVNLRIDYALGRDSNRGFYISFGESF
jgi:outer membrane protein assembly factor BamA